MCSSLPAGESHKRITCARSSNTAHFLNSNLALTTTVPLPLPSTALSYMALDPSEEVCMAAAISIPNDARLVVHSTLMQHITAESMDTAYASCSLPGIYPTHASQGRTYTVEHACSCFSVPVCGSEASTHWACLFEEHWSHFGFCPGTHNSCSEVFLCPLYPIYTTCLEMEQFVSFNSFQCNKSIANMEDAMLKGCMQYFHENMGATINTYVHDSLETFGDKQLNDLVLHVPSTSFITSTGMLRSNEEDDTPSRICMIMMNSNGTHSTDHGCVQIKGSVNNCKDSVVKNQRPHCVCICI
jgi:hypothetical protein